jgi:hypothetical protein
MSCIEIHPLSTEHERGDYLTVAFLIAFCQIRLLRAALLRWMTPHFTALSILLVAADMDAVISF